MVNIPQNAILKTPGSDLLRKDFPLLNRLVNGNPLAYLDNAATSQKPVPVLKSLEEFWTSHNANIHRGVHTLSQEATQLFESARESVRILLGAASLQEVIFTKGCTEGINLVAQSFARELLKPGDVILLSTMEHHSNIVPWQIVAEQAGARVEPIPISDSGEIVLEEYEKLFTSHPVKMVGLVHVSNALGTINPIHQMVKMAHSFGAKVLVDGAQAGPHLLVDVVDLDADFYTLSCHKIYAPTGVGVLYGKKALLEQMPPYHGGGDMIRTVSFEGTSYADLPAKFEAGTPNIAGVIGLGAAVRYLESLSASDEVNDQNQRRDRLKESFDAIARHERKLASKSEKELQEIPGIRIVGTAKEKTGIVSFIHQKVHPHDLGTFLDAQGVAIRTGHHCCMPLMQRFGLPATARASFAFYNNEEEVNLLVDGVRKAIGVLS